MPKIYTYLVVLLLFFTCNAAFAQGTYSINGTVKEATGETLPGATVFLADTKYYTATDDDGKFTLNDVEPGTYQLIIKMIGFVPYISKVTVGANTLPISIVLKDDNKLLKTVTIAATDPNREKYLKIFTQYFIGQSNNSDQCKILNPKVLNFHYDKTTGILQASADKTLTIENDGLGYQLNYLLTGFTFDTKNLIFSYTGYPYFEESKGSESQQKRWNKNRREAYLGSKSHFFRSVYDRTSSAQGFYLYATTDKAMRNTPANTLPVLSADSIFALTDFNNLKVLKAAYNKKTATDTTALYVLYHGDRSIYEYTTSNAIYNRSNSSMLTAGPASSITVTPGMRIKSPVTLTSKDQLSKLEPLTDTLFIDKNGAVIPQNSFLISGYWAEQKIAELVPSDYRVDGIVPPVSNISDEDNTGLSTIATKLEKLTATRPVEKVYLQFNKPSYSTTDTIWFKGYVTVGPHHQPSVLSKILYVELVDTKDKMLKSLQLRSENGIATGEFALSSKLLPGEYHIRAYTNWMRNAGPEYFFNQSVSIGDVKANSVFVTPSLSVSGDLSVNTKLAYTDKFGRAYDKREVVYEVRADTNLLYSGKGITDAAGNLSFVFPGKTAPGQRIKVTSHFKLVNGITIDKTTPLAVPDKNMDIQFFPEGGQLVNDVRSKVAFKAIGADGLGAEVKGVVVDNENNEVAYFSSQHAGMGVFAFTPQSGKTYTAKVTADDKAVNVPLPVAAVKGFVFAVNSNDSLMLSIRIATNAATLQEKQGNAFYVVGQSGGAVYFNAAGKLDNPSFTISVPKSRFPSGIAQFTLFSATDEPLNERVVFIQNHTDMLNLDLSAPKTSFGAKEKVNMAFSAKDNNGKPALGSFSVSVYNEDRLTANDNNESTILSNMLLTSDLKGYIEEPNYYFNTNNDQTQSRSDLDVLMLTQGYRRFEWKSVIAGNYPAINYQPEKSLSISGQLTSANGKPVIKGSLKVLALANALALDTVTDAEGKFALHNVDFNDSTKLVIEARKANDGKNVNISLDNNHTVPVIFKSNIADISENSIPPFLRLVANDNGEGNNSIQTIPLSLKADTTQIAATIKASTITEAGSGKTLNEVTIKDHKVDKPSQANLFGTIRPEAVVTGDQLQNYATIATALPAKDPSLVYRNGKLYTPRGALISVVINGFPIKPGDNIDDLLNVDQIEDVKVMESTALQASYGIFDKGSNDKVIVITTKGFDGKFTAPVGDTIKLNNGKIANNGKNLKEVTIKDRKIDKPDKSNLFGTLRPNMVVTGDVLQNYASIATALPAKDPSLSYRNGKLYDPMASKRRPVPTPAPIPVVINGQLMKPGDNIDDVVTIDQIEDVKVMQSQALKIEYGIPYENPNDKVIFITTKGFNGTFTALVGDTIKVNGGKNINLKEVTVKSRKNAGTENAPWMATVTHSANLNGPGHADQVISAKDLQDCPDLYDCMINKIPGIIHGQTDIYFAQAMGKSLTGMPPIRFMLDGNFTTADNLSSVNAADVETVEVLKSGSFLNVYGTGASGGLLIITSKFGTGVGGNDAIAFKSVPGIIYTKFNGFYQAKEFYTPKYTPDNIKTTDARTAIYWNPNITTDDKGIFPIEYFNSDVKGGYRAIVEGIDNDGNIGRFVYRYKVE